ncbi:hypothetical protein DRN93_05315 [archaeon]|nr:MAG: hypothetical protein DRN93_05315 [archaeon]
MDEIRKLRCEYVLVDTPGQMEIFISSTGMHGE